MRLIYMPYIKLASPPLGGFTVTEIGSISISGGAMVTPKDLYVTPDGADLFVQESGSADGCFRHTMSTPYDITTATFTNEKTGMDTTPSALSFKPDGTKYFQFGSGADSYQSTLSTAWDTSTQGSITNYNYTDINSSTFFRFNDDGTKAYKGGGVAAGILEVTLSTPYDITTSGSETLRSCPTSSINYNSFDFYDSGNYIWVFDSSANTVKLVHLSTAYDLSTMGDVIETHSVTNTNIDIVCSGGYIYGLNSTTKTVYQYSVT